MAQSYADKLLDTINLKESRATIRNMPELKSPSVGSSVGENLANVIYETLTNVAKSAIGIKELQDKENDRTDRELYNTTINDLDAKHNEFQSVISTLDDNQQKKIREHMINSSNEDLYGKPVLQNNPNPFELIADENQREIVRNATYNLTQAYRSAKSLGIDTDAENVVKFKNNTYTTAMREHSSAILKNENLTIAQLTDRIRTEEDKKNFAKASIEISTSLSKLDTDISNASTLDEQMNILSNVNFENQRKQYEGNERILGIINDAELKVFGMKNNINAKKITLENSIDIDNKISTIVNNPKAKMSDIYNLKEEAKSKGIEVPMSKVINQSMANIIEDFKNKPELYTKDRNALLELYPMLRDNADNTEDTKKIGIDDKNIKNRVIGEIVDFVTKVEMLQKEALIKAQEKAQANSDREQARLDRLQEKQEKELEKMFNPSTTNLGFIKSLTEGNPNAVANVVNNQISLGHKNYYLDGSSKRLQGFMSSGNIQDFQTEVNLVNYLKGTTKYSFDKQTEDIVKFSGIVGFDNMAKYMKIDSTVKKQAVADVNDEVSFENDLFDVSSREDKHFYRTHKKQLKPILILEKSLNQNANVMDIISTYRGRLESNSIKDKNGVYTYGKEPLRVVGINTINEYSVVKDKMYETFGIEKSKNSSIIMIADDKFDPNTGWTVKFVANGKTVLNPKLTGMQLKTIVSSTKTKK